MGIYKRNFSQFLENCSMYAYDPFKYAKQGERISEDVDKFKPLADTLVEIKQKGCMGTCFGGKVLKCDQRHVVDKDIKVSISLKDVDESILCAHCLLKKRGLL